MVPTDAPLTGHMFGKGVSFNRISFNYINVCDIVKVSMPLIVRRKQRSIVDVMRRGAMVCCCC